MQQGNSKRVEFITLIVRPVLVGVLGLVAARPRLDRILGLYGVEVMDLVARDDGELRLPDVLALIEVGEHDLCCVNNI